MADAASTGFPADAPPLAVPGRRYVPFTRAVTHEPAFGGVVVTVEDADGGTHRLRLTVWAPGVLRVQFRLDDSLPRDRPSAVLIAEREGAPLRIASDDGAITLDAPGLRARIARTPFRLAIADAGGRERFAGQVLDRTLLGWVSPPTGVWRDPDGTAGVHETLELAPDEAIVGLGETYLGLDLRGHRRVVWATDTFGLNTTDLAYKPVPFWLSSRGYGCLVHRSGKIVADVGALSSTTLGFAIAGPEMDYFVFLGSPRTVLERYTALTGRAPLPPRWALGVWMSRCMYRTRTEVEEVVEGMRARDLPLDVVHLDPLWLRGRAERVLDACDYEWDTDAFPDPPGFVRWLRERGVRLSLWENPYVPRDSAMFEEGKTRRFLALAPDGEPAVSIHNPDGAVVDFTSPEAAAWIAAKHRPLLEMGVACFKTDYGESVPADARFANGETGATIHNLYPLLYNRTVFDVTRATTGSGIVFARSATAGSQRYPVHWSGDAQSTWGGMAGALRGGLGFACSGGAWWGHDIGGFWGPDGFAPPSSRVYIRWAQFGLLSPIARFHGTTPREPWDFGEEAVEIVRAFSRLRYRLLPYLEACGLEAAATGLPVLRPFLLEFPDDPFAWRIDLEYLLGPLLLVAPMFDDGESRDVYLPAGDWWDWWDDVVHHGPGMVRVEAPLERLPLFVRGGSLLPLAPALPRADAGIWDPILIEVRGPTAGTIRVPDGGTILEAHVAAEEGRVAIGLAPSERAVAVRVCGWAGVPEVTLEEGTATWLHAADERGTVISVRAPAGARLALTAAGGR